MREKAPPIDMRAVEAEIAKAQYRRQSVRRVRLVHKIRLLEFELAMLRKDLELLDEEMAKTK
jgi:hypothetical protein